MRYILVASLMVCMAVHASAAEPKRLSEAGVRVSIINLIATPGAYHKKLVFISGYASIEFENNNLCLSKDPASTRDCVWINYDDGPYETDADMKRYEAKRREWAKYDGKLISIRGIFDAESTGHLGGSSGEIGHIVDVYER
jgi:hypothetical protein